MSQFRVCFVQGIIHWHVDWGILHQSIGALGGRHLPMGLVARCPSTSIVITMPNLLGTRWSVEHFLHHLSGFGVQPIFGPSKTILSVLGILRLSLNPNSACFTVVATDVSSNLQLVATWTANGVAKLLEVLKLQSGPTGHHWGSDWLGIDVLDWVVRKSDIDRRRPCTLQDILPVCYLHRVDARWVVRLIIWQNPDRGTGKYSFLGGHELLSSLTVDANGESGAPF